MITGWMVDMALLSRTVVSLGRPFEDGELTGKTAPPDDLHPRLPPATSTSTPKRGHTTPLTSHFKMAQPHCVKLFETGLPTRYSLEDPPS
jgi:hypothetical protein